MSVVDSGYSIHSNVFSEAECDALARSLSDNGMARSRAGARHLMSDPTVSVLAADSRLTAIARDAMGAGAVPFRATLFEKSAQTNWLIPWHQDTALPFAEAFDAPGWGPWSQKAGVAYAHAPAWALTRIVALRVHLDASTAGNGPLRVIPESHREGVLSDEEVLGHVRARDPVECLLPRGGVLAMRPLLIHSSSKARNDEPRRVLHIEYADSLELGSAIRLAVV